MRRVTTYTRVSPDGKRWTIHAAAPCEDCGTMIPVENLAARRCPPCAGMQKGRINAKGKTKKKKRVIE